MYHNMNIDSLSDSVIGWWSGEWLRWLKCQPEHSDSLGLKSDYAVGDVSWVLVLIEEVISITNPLGLGFNHGAVNLSP